MLQDTSASKNMYQVKAHATRQWVQAIHQSTEGRRDELNGSNGEGGRGGGGQVSV